MIKFLSLLFFACISQYSAAQFKIFLDKNENQVTESNAVLYRLETEDPAAGLTKMETFYKTNDSIMSKGFVTGNLERTGTWQWFYPNGNRRKITTYMNGVPSGQQTLYFSNGSIQERYSYSKERNIEMPFNYTFKASKDGTTQIKDGKGMYNGSYTGFLEPHVDSLSGTIINTKPHGVWTGFKNGQLVLNEIYNEGELVNGSLKNPSGTVTYTELYSQATPTIAYKKFNSMLRINVDFYWNERMKINPQDIQEKLILVFDVDTDGEVKNIRVENGLGKGPDVAVIKGLRDVDVKWNPATMRGVPFKTTLRIPYMFDLRN